MWIRALFLAAGVAAAVPAIAQPVVPALSLAQVLQFARQGPDARAAEHAWATARGDVLAADHAPLPTLSAKAASIDLQNGVGPGNALRDKRIDKAIGVDWTLERGNKRALRTRAAELQAEAARLDWQEALQQQQLTAAGAYFDLLAAQERVAHAEALEAAGSQLARAAQQRQKAGDLSQQDLLRTEIEAQRVRADLRTALAERQRASGALSQVTGQPLPLAAAGDWPGLAPLPDSPVAPGDRPDVQAASRRVDAAQAALEGALALRRTDITLGASIDHFPGTSTRQLELRVQMPLSGVFGTYAYQGEIARAQGALDQAQAMLERTTRAATTELLRLQLDARAAGERAEDYEQQILPRARRVAQLAELAYGRGAMPLTDLIEARRTLRAALLEDLAARTEHARARTALALRRTPSAAP